MLDLDSVLRPIRPVPVVSPRDGLRHQFEFYELSCWAPVDVHHIRRLSDVLQECECQVVLMLNDLRPQLLICYLGRSNLCLNKDSVASVS